MISFLARVRPFFGAVVLTTLLLIAAGVYSAFRLPSGVYPEVTFPRISVVANVPQPRPDHDGPESHPAAGRGRRHGHRRLRGPFQNRSRRIGIVHHLHARHRHAPGHGAGLEPHRLQALRAARRPGFERRADDAVDFAHHFGRPDRRRRLGPAPRLRLLSADPAHQEHSGYPVRRGVRRRRARDRGDRPAGGVAGPRPVRRRPRRPDRPDQSAPADRPRREPAAGLSAAHRQPVADRPADSGSRGFDARRPNHPGPRRGRCGDPAPGPHAVDRFRPEGRRRHHGLPPPRRQYDQHFQRPPGPAGQGRSDAAGRRSAQGAAAQHSGDAGLRPGAFRRGVGRQRARRHRRRRPVQRADPAAVPAQLRRR